MHIESALVLAIIFTSLIYTWWKKVYFTPVLLVVNMAIFFIALGDLYFSPAYSAYGLSNIQVELSYSPIYLGHPSMYYTLLSSMYIHSGFLHVFFNMLVLFLIGMPLEERIGTKRFAVIYLVGGLAGTLTYTAFSWGHAGLLMGASGAISAAMGAMLVLYPRDEIPMMLGPILMQRVPVWMSVGLFFGLETAAVFAHSVDGVAHTAHIGGIIAGILLGPILVRKHAEKVRAARVEDFTPLRDMAATPAARDAYENLISEDMDEVRELWLDRFTEMARCPVCGGPIQKKGRKFYCEKCDYRKEI